MAISQAMCTSFKRELLEGGHNFKNSGGNAFWIALYESTATLGEGTTAYGGTVDTSGSAPVADTSESSGTGYTANGKALTRIDPSIPAATTTAITDFGDISWTSATIDAAGALIYNTDYGGSSNTGNAVCVLSFGGTKTSTNGTFQIQFPTADASNAIIRIA